MDVAHRRWDWKTPVLTGTKLQLYRFHMDQRKAKYGIGDVVRHRIDPFRGVIFDVDPSFSNTEEWHNSIPEDVRPSRDQPFYHLFAENAESEYIAYVSEQNLLPSKRLNPCVILKLMRFSKSIPKVVIALERDRAN